MTRTLLVAGHGYLGGELTRRARAASWTVPAVSRHGGGDARACDLTVRAEVAALAVEIPWPDAIVFTASSGRGGPDAYRSIFLEGARHLLEAFRGVRFLFVSSTSVYGQTDGSLVTEESPAVPARETGRILLEAERQVLAAGGAVTRLAGIYGPGRSVILERFLAGEAVIEEDGRRFLNQIHRDDAAAALLHLASRPEGAAGETYNVADSEPIAQIDCYRALAEIFGRPLPPRGPRNLHRKRAWTHKRVSNRKLLATGWVPRYPSFLGAARETASTL